MVAMYPVAYRTAAAIALGGLRGAPGGVVGFAAGAVLTALYLAWELSKRKPLIPDVFIDYGRGPHGGDPFGFQVDRRAGGLHTVGSGAQGSDYVEDLSKWLPVPNPALHGWSRESTCREDGTPTGDWYIAPGQDHTCWVQQAGVFAPWNASLVDDTAAHQDAHENTDIGFPHRGTTRTIYFHTGGNADVVNEPDITASDTVIVPIEGSQEPVSYAESPGSDRGNRVPAVAGAVPVQRPQDRLTRLGAGITLQTILSTSAARSVAAPAVREVKLHITMFGRPLGVEFIGALFEALDLVDALYAGFFPNRKPPFRNSVDKLEFILTHIDEIDWQVVASVIEDQLDDFAIGLSGRVLAAMGAAAGLPFGLGTFVRAADLNILGRDR